MNKKALFISLFAAVCLIAPSAQAMEYTGSVTIPEDAVGVSEKTYTSLNTANCAFQDGKCDAILEQFDGKVIFRAEGHGEMYRVRVSDGLPFINRYLPDGIYSSGKKFYVVQDGIRIRVKKSNAATKIREQLGHRNPSFQLVTPVGESFMSKSFQSCDTLLRDTGSTNNEGSYDNIDGLTNDCESGFVAGTVSDSAFAGRVFANVDDKGKIYYARPNYWWQTAHEISSNNSKAFKQIKRLAVPVDQAAISGMISLQRI